MSEVFLAASGDLVVMHWKETPLKIRHSIRVILQSCGVESLGAL
jgi:hypothetical protein